jgi:2-polyprenyl-6-methoxyphenol hydroxylase-like FAD-dependent oxidoreductase
MTVALTAAYQLKGCDGAHSSVRRSLGYQMIGDSTDAVWGVMDIYPRTNFPDIRKKATLHSNSGNLLVSNPFVSYVLLPSVEITIT